MAPVKSRKTKRLPRAGYATKRARTSLGRIVRQAITNYEEKKFFVNNFTYDNTQNPVVGQLVTNTWTCHSLLTSRDDSTGITQGIGASQRVGNRIRLQGIRLTVRISPVPGASQANNAGSLCRMVIWHDKQCNSAATAPTLIFTNNTADLAISANYNPVYEHRITKHQDFAHAMVSTGVDSANQMTMGPTGQYVIEIPARTVIEFTGSADGQAALAQDNWGIAYCGDGANCCHIQAEALVRYVDA